MSRGRDPYAAPAPRARRPERLIVDLSAPLGSLTFAVLECVLITAVAWIAIGYLDGPGAGMVSVDVRNGVVGVWAVLLAWRLLLPLLRARHQLFQLTDRRIRVRPARLTARTGTIRLGDVVDANRRRRGTLTLLVRGYDRPLVFERVAHTRKVVGLIRERLR